jgi:hypothetical protein
MAKQHPPHDVGRPPLLIRGQAKVLEDYQPLEAIEVPREVIEERYGEGRVSWTQQLVRDPRVRHVAIDNL